MDLQPKFNKTLAACFEEGSVYFDGDEFLFTLAGGAQAFVDHLVPTLTDDEASEWITEYVATNHAGWLLMAKSPATAVAALSIEAAKKILWSDDSQQFLFEERKHAAAFYRASLMDDCDSVMNNNKAA